MSADLDFFKQKLAAYKSVIDADINKFSKKLHDDTAKNYTQASTAAIDAYLSILSRGGKRIRGSLTMAGFEMVGGKDKIAILAAARIVEMLHAYILITDDIADNSDVRRGGQAAHIILAQYHNQNNLLGNDGHFGESLAVAASLIGSHSAMEQLASLNLDSELKIKAIKSLNNGLTVTGHGQVNDLYNEFALDVSEEEVEKVLEWKTAHYTFLNPLQLGMILGGADDKTVDQIKDYAFHAGRLFQITDDIIGVFGSEEASGKSPMDDLREGKRTLLSVYALKHTTDEDKQFLAHMLGNIYITPEEFKRCQDIIQKSGALKHAKAQASKSSQAALKVLESPSPNWDESGIKFMRGMISYLLTRNT